VIIKKDRFGASKAVFLFLKLSRFSGNLEIDSQNVNKF
jgi:hypothetical protein